jgi:hypothetical protein
MIAGGNAQRGQVLRCPDIPERDTHVAQKTAALGSSNRRIAKQFPESPIVELEKISQLHRYHARPGGERGFPCPLREAIPRARVQAVIATENPVADQRPEFRGDAAFEFDR